MEVCMKSPKILSVYEFMKMFSTEGKCIRFLEKNIYKNGVLCDFCKARNVSKKNRKTGFHQCRECRKQFNVRTNTIFHRSKIELRKWFYAIYLFHRDRKGISSLQLAKQIGITQKSAWFMLQRIREACKAGSELLTGDVEVDETYFGGKNRNRHKSKKFKHKESLKAKVMV